MKKLRPEDVTRLRGEEPPLCYSCNATALPGFVTQHELTCPLVVKIARKALRKAASDIGKETLAQSAARYERTHRVHMITTPRAGRTVCDRERTQGLRITSEAGNVTCDECAEILHMAANAGVQPHSPHWCLACGGTIHPEQPETLVKGRGQATGRRRYLHANQDDCMAGARGPSRYQRRQVSGGTMGGKR